MTNNSHVLNWIEAMKALVKPDKVVWISGEEEQIKALKAEAVATGIMEELNPEKLPGCLLHRTKPNDVARVEARTFICTTKKEMAGAMVKTEVDTMVFFSVAAEMPSCLPRR